MAGGLAACLRVEGCGLPGAAVDGSGGASEIARGGGVSTSIVAKFLLSRSIVGIAGSFRGNLSALAIGAPPSLLDVVSTDSAEAVLSGGTPALMIVVRIKRAPSSGAHKRASQVILGIAAALWESSNSKRLSVASVER